MVTPLLHRDQGPVSRYHSQLSLTMDTWNRSGIVRHFSRRSTSPPELSPANKSLGKATMFQGQRCIPVLFWDRAPIAMRQRRLLDLYPGIDMRATVVTAVTNFTMHWRPFPKFAVTNSKIACMMSFPPIHWAASRTQSDDPSPTSKHAIQQDDDDPFHTVAPLWVRWTQPSPFPNKPGYRFQALAETVSC
ncbi:hypothetical protein BU23DRAFT_233310 [Bimuria novae-zelandiae CBS 107.79]|uniref:Uncharacterized protein n=1 Tax=Bimuria novae-zelandiae CBS 107.79 TaxID=1447943 RepID=A0A6A5UYB2_9PLEO|nr:hypothetical protein BU23DRAFT_233310 [Bimuria novae-zelandiae CBS 107.79]